MKVKIIALGMFGTSDAAGIYSAKAGDILEVSEFLAKQLIKQGLAKKYREPKSVDTAGEVETSEEE